MFEDEIQSYVPKTTAESNDTVPHKESLRGEKIWFFCSIILFLNVRIE